MEWNGINVIYGMEWNQWNQWNGINGINGMKWNGMEWNYYSIIINKQINKLTY
jgi:hypothetical protein